MFQVRYDDDPRWPFLYKIRMFECVKNVLINEIRNAVEKSL